MFSILKLLNTPPLAPDLLEFKGDLRTLAPLNVLSTNPGSLILALYDNTEPVFAHLPILAVYGGQRTRLEARRGVYGMCVLSHGTALLEFPREGTIQLSPTSHNSELIKRCLQRVMPQTKITLGKKANPYLVGGTGLTSHSCLRVHPKEIYTELADIQRELNKFAYP